MTDFAKEMHQHVSEVEAKDNAPIKKYYFLSCMSDANPGQGHVMEFKPFCTATARHPFQWLYDLNKRGNGHETVLISWQEITQEEFDLYNKLEEQLNS